MHVDCCYDHVCDSATSLLSNTAAFWHQGWGDMEGASDGSFLEWVGRSQLYSGDVLAPEALDDVTGWMAQAAPGDKRQMMALLRELHATISPTGSGPALHAHTPSPPPPSPAMCLLLGVTSLVRFYAVLSKQGDDMCIGLSRLVLLSAGC